MSAKLSDPSKARAFQYRALEGGGEVRLPEFLKQQGQASAQAGREEGGSGDGSPRDPHEVEREAFQKGFEAGERAGMEMAEKKTGAVLKRFAGSLEKISRLREELLGRCERDVVALSLEIARRIVKREVEMDEKIIATFVRVALEKLNIDSRVTIHLHPSDREFLSRHLDEVFSDRRDVEIILKNREDINRGDCLIESDHGTVDARIAEQFKEIETGLLDGL